MANAIEAIADSLDKVMNFVGITQNNWADDNEFLSNKLSILEDHITDVETNLEYVNMFDNLQEKASELEGSILVLSDNIEAMDLDYENNTSSLNELIEYGHEVLENSFLSSIEFINEANLKTISNLQLFYEIENLSSNIVTAIYEIINNENLLDKTIMSSDIENRLSVSFQNKAKELEEVNYNNISFLINTALSNMSDLRKRVDEFEEKLIKIADILSVSYWKL